MAAPAAVGPGGRQARVDDRRLPRVAGDDHLMVGLGLVKPASRSMYESSLYQRETWEAPEMRGVNTVRHALQVDAASQSKKYGSQEPNSGSARFNAELPHCPQNRKYSWTVVQPAASLPSSSTVQDPNRAPAFPGGLGFNKQTLQRWFREIDRDASGVITQRELIVALHQRQDLLDFFCRINGIQQKKGTARTPQQEAQSRREEILRIKDILKEVDTDGSGSMEWDEFVDFFRRAGLLLEYQTKTQLNRTSLCRELELTRQREQEKEAALDQAPRRTAVAKMIGRLSARLSKCPDSEDSDG